MTGAYFSASAVLARIDLLYPLAVEAADATQDPAYTRAYVTVMKEKGLTAALKQVVGNAPLCHSLRAGDPYQARWGLTCETWPCSQPSGKTAGRHRASPS